MGFSRPTPKQAIEAVRSILAAYPHGGAQAGDAYIGACARLLAEFPLDVVAKASDYRRGIPSVCKFVPSIAELADWCERELGRREPHRVYPLLPALEKPKRTPEQQARIDAQVARWKEHRP